MEAAIIDCPGLALAGHSIATRKADGDNLRDIPAFWADYAARLRQPLLDALRLPHAAEYGVVYDFDPAGGGFRYLIAIECPDAAALPPGVERRRLPPARYAVFTTPPAAGPAEFGQRIAQTWQRIYQDWLPASADWQHAPGDVFERYDGRCAPGQTRLQMDIYLPIQPKLRQGKPCNT
ncbi:GyrI-like domain-containing protein [Chromobacterium subtsugae]|uniref:GyrI-like domain-containing protein n=1 Tax=Chromobacterium subtsugae TaxID=251747 RepID=A0ABS7FIK7_9NEIS|nr:MULTISPECIES: GyrI-like domain-containing protein [Chromobacterium]KUM01690.1 AraC family transcriptional regulator [Chromobacterium subtsugae]KZE84593.1 AraC family transcriptional regulator [Chromobacterium sp. F49]MBW7568204.1 AraC family transcriptional regulator [Chromobacterium subtsugae]MBW8289315.1 GyrI-like domain-containing protein [Chromobacterium subtsugae]OBU87540.1 AraC family transcriptional regulator [Chromobacterium subtsugae]